MMRTNRQTENREFNYRGHSSPVDYRVKRANIMFEIFFAVLAIRGVLVPLRFKSLFYHINNKVAELIPSVSPQEGPIFLSEGQN